jgi:antitoxin YefM
VSRPIHIAQVDTIRTRSHLRVDQGGALAAVRAAYELDEKFTAEDVYTMRYTSIVAKMVPVREFRTNLSAFLSDVADRRDHVLVTRNGRPAAALVPIDEYDALEETAEILSDSQALVAIEAGLAEVSRDETVTLADLRAEIDARRSTP